MQNLMTRPRTILPRTILHVRHGLQRHKKAPAHKDREPPRLWYVTDEHKAPTASEMIKTLPRGSGLGVLIRATTPAGENQLTTSCIMALKARRISGYLIRRSAWHSSQTPLRPGQVGWHVTQASPPLMRSAYGRTCLYSTGYHPRTEPLSSRRTTTHDSDLIFVSPVFATSSHTTATAAHIIGPVRFRLVCRALKKRRHNTPAPNMCARKIYALGGLSSQSIRRIRPWGMAAIDLWHKSV